jgi:hypothetical protein
MNRDRDESGRPRNARSRDALGRPLPRGVPGVDSLPEQLRLGPDETLAESQRLLDAGFPFQAHEVLEAAWKEAPPGERELWQGLAQLAVGLTHALRGNAAGAAAVLSRGAERLNGYLGSDPYGIDVAGVIAWAHEVGLNAAAAGEAPAPPRLRG